jgi:DNA-binding response OmpR family regulator
LPKEKILVVDDGPDVIATLRRILEFHNYFVVSAFDGMEAVEKVKSEKPDLIILDAMLPRMSGWKVCKKLREEEETRRIPIIMLTARDSSIDKARGLQIYKVDAYITKPFSVPVLLKKIEGVLERNYEWNMRDEGKSSHR